MIRYLLHNEIDFAKYDHCISESENSLIYGYSWYLDIVAPNWTVLVLNNYEAVMPLPKRKKYGVSYIFQPSWVQQLGVFSNNEIRENLMMSFIDAIPIKFKLVDILLNYNNQFSSKYLSKRKNFTLNLNNSYPPLFDKYNKLRKRSVKKAQNLNLIVKEIGTAQPIIDLFKKNKGAQLEKSESDYKLLNQLVLKGVEQQKAEILCVENIDNNIIGGVVFLKNKNRIIYLFSAVNEEGKEYQTVTFIIDYIIKKYSYTNMTLDFEGSMIPNIAKFFKSFGAAQEDYYWYYRRRII